MFTWKKNIFVNAINIRMIQENKPADEIITDYVALTDDEKKEILTSIG